MSDLKKPVVLYDHEIEFDDGTRVDVFGLAKDWARWHHQLYGDTCMGWECDQPATIDLTVWGHLVGRVCSQHSGDLVEATEDHRIDRIAAQRTVERGNQWSTGGSR